MPLSRERGSESGQGGTCGGGGESGAGTPSGEAGGKDSEIKAGFVSHIVDDLLRTGVPDDLLRTGGPDAVTATTVGAVDGSLLTSTSDAVHGVARPSCLLLSGERDNLAVEVVSGCTIAAAPCGHRSELE